MSCLVKANRYFYKFLLQSKHRTGLQREKQMNPSEQQSTSKLKYQYLQQKKPKLDRRLRRKTFCPQHPMQKLIYKCAEQDCKQPFICLHSECIDAHFHTPTLKLTRINLAAFEEKFQRTQQAIANSEKFFSEAFQIKAVVDSLKNSVTALFKDVNGMGKVFADLKADVDSALNSSFINKVEEALSMENRIKGAIQKIKAKINLPQQQQRNHINGVASIDLPPQGLFNEDFLLKSEIGSFLQANIVNFSWKNASTLVKIPKQNYPSQQFHSALAGRSNLLYLFVGENMVVGSYFSSAYPVGKGVVNDPTSFIFTAKQQPQLKILKFLANSDSTHHMEVAEGFLVMQGQLAIENKGLKITHDDLDTLQICLPTQSFVAENVSEDGVNEALKLEQFLVFQVENSCKV